jgi:hypothetical protein
MNEGNYYEAIAGFYEIEHYRNALQRIDECYYEMGLNAFSSDPIDFELAERMFAECSVDNEEVYGQIQQVYYNYLTNNLEANPLAIYENIFRTPWLSDFSDADILFNQCLFNLGKNELASSIINLSLPSAVIYFDQIDDADQLAQAKETLYLQAVQSEEKSPMTYRHILASDFMRDYKDSEELVLEHDYQAAKQLYDSGRYVQAYAAYSDIDNSYKDVATMLSRCISEGYNSEASKYRTTGRASFSNAMYDGYRDIDKYRLLIEARVALSLPRYSEYDDNDNLRQMYWKLRDLGSFGDAEDLRNSERFTYALLEGTYWSSWDSAIRGYAYFQMDDNDTRTTEYWLRASSFYSTSYGPYYSIEGTIYRTGSDDKGWREEFRFEFVDRNTLKLYAYRDGRTYTLRR